MLNLYLRIKKQLRIIDTDLKRTMYPVNKDVSVYKKLSEIRMYVDKTV